MNNQALNLNNGRLKQFIQLKAVLFQPQGVVFDVMQDFPDRFIRESVVRGADLVSGQGGAAALGHHDADQHGNDLFKTGHSRRKLFNLPLQPLDLALVGFPAHSAIVTRAGNRGASASELDRILREGLRAESSVAAPNEIEAGKGV